MTRFRLAVLCSLLIAVGCRVDFDPIVPPDGFPDPTPDDTPTPAPPIEVVPERSDALLGNPDGGWVASAGNEPWATLVARAGGGEPFAPASVIEFRGTLAQWFAPGDGTNPAQAATGSMAAAMQAALDAERYVGLRLVALVAADLPPGWPTTAAPAGSLPDGVLSLLLPAPVGDDDDSAGDDDDSAGDDDDSAGDDDDSAGDDDDSAPPIDLATALIDVSDPDWLQSLQVVLGALADRFADAPGLALLTVGGFGVDGTWAAPDGGSWIGPGPMAPFTEPSWVATVSFATELHRGLFPDVPAFIGWTVLRDAGGSADSLVQILAGDEISLRDDCFGACAQYDTTRFPGEPGTPYPADDPYGGWLIGAYHQGLGAAHAGGQGGLGAWRAAAAVNAWDVATFGPVREHLEAMVDVRLRHAPPVFVSLGDTACTSQYAVAEAPTGGECATQAGPVWPPLLDLGRSVGPRLVVTAVRAPGNWRALPTFELELDLGNEGGAAPLTGRQLELRLRLGEDVLASHTFATEVLDAVTLTPGTTRALSVTLDPSSTPPAGSEVVVEVRMPYSRSFSGWLAWPHPQVDADGWTQLATLATAD